MLDTWKKRAEVEQYDIDESGGFFSVKLYKDFVIKRPKKSKAGENPLLQEQNLQHMVDCQNALSKDLHSISPCFKEGMNVYTKRATGKRFDQLPTQELKAVKKLLEEDIKKIYSLGYEFVGGKPHKKNVFYDPPNIEIIDFHRICKQPHLSAGTLEKWLQDNKLTKSKWAAYQDFYYNGQLLLKGRRDLQERYALINLSDLKGKNIIDLGCNIGMCAYWAVENGAKTAVGFDYTEDYIKIAKGINIFLKEPCSFYHVDLSKPIQCNQTFDVGFVFALHQHVKNDLQLAENIKNLITNVVYFETNIHKNFNTFPDSICKLFKEVTLLGKTDKHRRNFYRCIL